jgi:hypothetical protein
MLIVRLVLSIAFFCIASAEARDMMLTIYDDGLSCPGDCDAHVVLNESDNGTRQAFKPDSSRSSPSKCVAGQQCIICFSDADNSCMSALYRGGGPAKGRFDFTPAFYDANCSRNDIPAALVSQCRTLDRAASKLGYASAINCFETPENPKCATVVARGKAAQEADAPKRAMCLSMGEAAFNRSQTDPKERRTNACDYSLLALGGNSHSTWKKLLPAGQARTLTLSDLTAAPGASASPRQTIRNVRASFHIEVEGLRCT